MAKKRSLKDDAAMLKKKVGTAVQGCDNPEGDSRVRSLRKRLKRAQRRLRTIAKRAEGPKSKKAGAKAS